MGRDHPDRGGGTRDGDPNCDGLAAALAGDDAVEVTLVLGATGEDPFRVVEWRACGSVWPACPGGGG